MCRIPSQGGDTLIYDAQTRPGYSTVMRFRSHFNGQQTKAKIIYRKYTYVATI
jgi:hypothetical protein